MRLNEDLWDNSDASRLPDLYQYSGEPVDPKLREYIFDGELCEYTEDMRAENMQTMWLSKQQTQARCCALDIHFTEFPDMKY